MCIFIEIPCPRLSFVSRRTHSAQRNQLLPPMGTACTVPGCVLIPIYQSSDSDVKGSDTSHMCGMCGPSRHPLILLQPPWVTAARDKTSGHRQLCLTESPWYNLSNVIPLWFVVLLITLFITVPCYSNVNLKDRYDYAWEKFHLSLVDSTDLTFIYITLLINFSSDHFHFAVSALPCSLTLF